MKKRYPLEIMVLVLTIIFCSFSAWAQTGITKYGTYALNNNTTGGYNTGIGYYALYSNTTGHYNTANGSDALRHNISGHWNTANGYRALYMNTTGIANTANGFMALYANTTGSDNTAVGLYALHNNTTGSYNTANGLSALHNNTTGSYNTANGRDALRLNRTGSYNTAFGWGAGDRNVSGSRNVFIGYRAGFYETGSNKLYIENSSGTPLIYKNFSSNRVGINTKTPDYTLDVNGSLGVNGSIYQKGTRIHADYVFEPDYKLESIKEHAEFMWKNKHLKTIPKATVDENGLEVVEVGAHRRGIVEKLEKAHIYIEQLYKRLENMEILEEKLVKLEKRLAQLKTVQ